MRVEEYHLQQQQQHQQQLQQQLQQQQQHHEVRVVRNIAGAVEDYAAGLTRDAKFLNETGIENSVAVFHSSELVLGKLLGSGGFSQVYEVRQFNLMQTQPSAAASEMNLARRIVESTAVDYKGQATYALKHLDKRLLQNPDEFCAAAADLYVEAKYMSRFNHKNILSLKGMAHGGISALNEGRYNGFFILTDRLTDTLDDRIERWGQEGVSGVHQLVLKTNYALQMAQALEYLHERRIIFRDLKPQNIGFCNDDVVKLFDFGLCRELPSASSNTACNLSSTGNPEDMTFKMSEAGTKRYMAPEIYKCMGSMYNLKVDCYSWAAVFYEMLSLEKPYSRVSDAQFQTFVLAQGLRPPLAPYHLPKQIEHVIQQAWTQNHVQRPSMPTIRQTLQGIIKGWELQHQMQLQQQQQQQAVFAAAMAPPVLRAQVSTGALSMGGGGDIVCHSPFGWNHAPAQHQQHHHHHDAYPQQLAASPSPAPVFTFDEDLPITKTMKRMQSAEVTLTTENSTAYWGEEEEDFDDISISTFDYSVSELMQLSDEPVTGFP